jgi:hypothetical protein
MPFALRDAAAAQHDEEHGIVIGIVEAVWQVVSMLKGSRSHAEAVHTLLHDSEIAYESCRVCQ